MSVSGSVADVSLRVSRLSNVMYVAGVIVLLVLPFIQRQISVSEHALTMGNLESSFTRLNARRALELSSDYQSLNFNGSLSHIRHWLIERMQAAQMDTQIHSFGYENKSVEGVNIAARIRARKSSGKDAIIISFPYIGNGNDSNVELKSASARVGLAVSLMEHFRNVAWLQKDIYFLAFDGRWKYNEAVDKWLQTVFSPEMNATEDFMNPGFIIAALSLEFSNRSPKSLSLLSLGINGQLPDMDILATIAHNSEYHLVPYRRLYDIFSVFPPYISGMFTFMAEQAIGVPRGAHAYFMKYNIPSATISDLQTEVDSIGNEAGIDFMYSIARTLDQSVRSLNNLIEPLHASYLFYLLPSMKTVIPSSEYSVAMILILLYGVFKACSILVLDLDIKFRNVLWSVLCIVVATLGSMTPHLCWLLPFDVEPWVIISGWSSFCTVFSVVYSKFVVPFITHMVLNPEDELPKSTLRAISLLWVTILGACTSVSNWSFGMFVLVAYIPICCLFKGRLHGIGRWCERIVHVMLVPDFLLLYLGLACKRYPSDIFFMLVDQWVRFHTFLLPLVVVLHTPMFIVFSVQLYHTSKSPNKEKVE